MENNMCKQKNKNDNIYNWLNKYKIKQKKTFEKKTKPIAIRKVKKENLSKNQTIVNVFEIIIVIIKISYKSKTSPITNKKNIFNSREFK